MKATHLSTREESSRGGMVCIRETGALMLLIACLGWGLAHSGLATSLTPAEQSEDPGPIHKLMAGSSDRDLWILRRSHGVFRQSLNDGSDEQVLPREYPTTDVAVHADERNTIYAVARYDGLLEIWWNGRIVVQQSQDTPDDYFRRVVFADHGKLMLAISLQGRLQVWRSTETTFQLEDDRYLAAGLDHVAVSADARFAACVSQGCQILIWDLQESRQVLTWDVPTSQCTDLAWSPDGTTLATVGLGREYGRLWLWDAATGRSRWETAADIVDPSAVMFSPTGDRVITGGFDRRVRIWDASTGALLAKHGGHDDTVRALAIAHSGDRVYSGGLDGRLLSWPL
jgi:WD40 repeat protein